MYHQQWREHTIEDYESDDDSYCAIDADREDEEDVAQQRQQEDDAGCEAADEVCVRGFSDGVGESLAAAATELEDVGGLLPGFIYHQNVVD